jgi:rfaE bifunctional protein kinase chain/domain
LADHYIYGQTERVSREAPVLIVRHEREIVKLGGGANAAANASALGARVFAVGVLGRDPMGRQMSALFKRQRVTLNAVPVPVTETRTRILAGGLSTTRQQMLRIDRGLIGNLSSRVRSQLAHQLIKTGRRADVVLVSDYGAGVLCAETREALRELARQGTLVSVDSRFHLAEFKGMTVCKPNEPELAALTGMPTRTDKELVSAGQAAQDLLDCKVLLVTRGHRGMTLMERGQKAVHIPAHGSADAVDVTGAGDTVSAMFATALGAGASAVTAARLANVAGSLVVQKEGTATVTREEIRKELDQ